MRVGSARTRPRIYNSKTTIFDILIFIFLPLASALLTSFLDDTWQRIHISQNKILHAHIYMNNCNITLKCGQSSISFLSFSNHAPGLIQIHIFFVLDLKNVNLCVYILFEYYRVHISFSRTIGKIVDLTIVILKLLFNIPDLFSDIFTDSKN